MTMCFSIKLPLDRTYVLCTGRGFLATGTPGRFWQCALGPRQHWVPLDFDKQVAFCFTWSFFPPQVLSKDCVGIFLVVQWLRLCTPNAGGTSLIPNWGTKISDVVRCSQNLNSNEKDSEVLFPTSAQYRWEMLCIWDLCGRKNYIKDIVLCPWNHHDKCNCSLLSSNRPS